MVVQELKKLGIGTAYGYIEKNPKENLPKLMRWVDRLAGTGPNSFEPHRQAVWEVLNHPESNMYKLIMRIIDEVDPEVMKTFFTNFFVNAILTGWPKQEAAREKYQCNVPWTILLDPTSACNKHCTGCWAAEYGHRLNLSFDEIDNIITQGKELGVYFYIYTGGEPLVRKKDLMAICRKHSDCIFLSFTNGSLIDEEFAQEMLRVKNFVPAISVEGDEGSHDGRRGDGSFHEVLNAMQILRSHRLPFGVSCCYTSVNYQKLSSDAFYDQLVDWGALFAWYFHYMPVGNDASVDLLLNPEQREYMYHRIRYCRAEKPIFGMDFQNDGEYVGGCIAGGRRYFHINANGDADPCVFIHYSDSNIREKTLVECLQGPMFMAYHDGQPFNENHLRPCPMLENPEKLREMVERTGARSTDMQSPESADHLCAKCDRYAQNWTGTADRLWDESLRKKQEKRKQKEKQEQQDRQMKKAVGQ